MIEFNLGSSDFSSVALSCDIVAVAGAAKDNLESTPSSVSVIGGFHIHSGSNDNNDNNNQFSNYN